MYHKIAGFEQPLSICRKFADKSFQLNVWNGLKSIFQTFGISSTYFWVTYSLEYSCDTFSKTVVLSYNKQCAIFWNRPKNDTSKPLQTAKHFMQKSVIIQRHSPSYLRSNVQSMQSFQAETKRHTSARIWCKQSIITEPEFHIQRIQCSGTGVQTCILCFGSRSHLFSGVCNKRQRRLTGGRRRPCCKAWPTLAGLHGDSSFSESGIHLIRSRPVVQETSNHSVTSRSILSGVQVDPPPSHMFV